ncbi:hypothetical protein HDV02_003950 [Globomyces sp. JEL0801]|nr:hypothetical protein HDV02_003950 [Globomyces sp. JEL0801]
MGIYCEDVRHVRELCPLRLQIPHLRPATYSKTFTFGSNDDGLEEESDNGLVDSCDDESEDRNIHSYLKFKTREGIVNYLKSYYKDEYVILTTKKSREGWVALKCDRGGIYISTCKQGRKSSSRLTGCPFEVVTSLRKEKWKVRKLIDTHNHEITRNLAGHSVARRPPNNIFPHCDKVSN